ncbi:hypothetical protein [Clostridium drakei]|uniref:Uncharacterized protein n=1 Tax=Clostridium drakei TaxID=332101 RepID=A0A2U8DWH7_9CLOT|nr:hypothetical protein [Clostridium drakei]AWI06745.1 hypothetical protein B9W14_20340 [Clostridium drakei]
MHKRSEFDRYTGEEAIDNICYEYSLFQIGTFQYPEAGVKEHVEAFWKELFKIINKVIFEGKDTEEYIDMVKNKTDREDNDIEDEETIRNKVKRIFDVTATYRQEKGRVKEIQFTVTPLKAFDLNVLYKELKYTFIIKAEENFSKDFLREIIGCTVDYWYNSLLAENLIEFNQVIDEIIMQYEFNKSKEEFIGILGKGLEKLKVKFKIENREVIKNFDDLMDYNGEDKVEPVVDIINMIMNSIKSSGYSSVSEKDSLSKVRKDARDGFINEIFDQIRINNYIDKLQENQYKLVEIFALLREVSDIVIKTVKSLKVKHCNISFGLGEGFLDVSEEYAVIGLSEDVIKDLSTLALFDEFVEERVEAYKEDLLNAVFTYKQPYGIIKVKPDRSMVPKELGIYSIEALHNLFKKYTHRDINSSKARIGVAYYEDNYEDKDIFAVIEKIPVTEREAEEICETDDCLIMDNIKPSVEEKRKGKTKIKVIFKIKPYDKKTNDYVDMKLKDILKTE